MIHLRGVSKGNDPITVPPPQSVDEKIESAQDRHIISDKYHTQAYPQFLRSHGPYKVYDHAEQKGTKEKISKINQLADERFKQEMNQIKSVKEFEKNKFQMSLFKKELLANHS